MVTHTHTCQARVWYLAKPAILLVFSNALIVFFMPEHWTPKPEISDLRYQSSSYLFNPSPSVEPYSQEPSPTASNWTHEPSDPRADSNTITDPRPLRVVNGRSYRSWPSINDSEWEYHTFHNQKHCGNIKGVVEGNIWRNILSFCSRLTNKSDLAFYQSWD